LESPIEKPIEARYREVQARVPAGVTLIAVSKTHPADAIEALYRLGHRDFGENYAQELVDKRRALADLPDARFRFIGGFQRNKAKLLVDAGAAVETLAGIEAARTLHDRAHKQGVALEVMLQVNALGEPQKSGVAPAALPALAEAVRALSALRLTGLMTIPPADDPGAAREAYALVAAQARALGLTELSMGMSDDLELAIRAGSTSVRVGTAIFGPRPGTRPA
jgi:PLP dependent protein